MGSVQRGIEVVEFACGIPQLLKGEYSENVGTAVDTHTVRQPVGVCAGITPFNFPAMVPLWMFPMAIACGNTFILKPSEKVPLGVDAHGRAAQGSRPARRRVQRRARRQGGGRRDARTIRTSRRSPSSARRRSPSTSTRPGAKNGKRVQALGGAKNHAVVLPDADLEFAADALIGAAYGSAGERCMAISAVVAVGAAADPLVALLEKKAKAIKIGPGRPGRRRHGPAGHARSTATRSPATSTRRESEGAKVVLDGAQGAGSKEGFFLGTSLFDNVKPEMQIYKDEIFGPVLVVLRVKTLDEAIELVNTNPYANGTAIFTESGGAARRFENEIQVGMVGINVPIPVPVAFYSFGGWKNSLFGDLHVHGMEGVKFYTRTKVVTTRWPHQDTPAPGFNMPTWGNHEKAGNLRRCACLDRLRLYRRQTRRRAHVRHPLRREPHQGRVALDAGGQRRQAGPVRQPLLPDQARAGLDAVGHRQPRPPGGDAQRPHQSGRHASPRS